MAITTYNAQVEFVVGKPYDAGHGPSVNVGLKILDGNDEWVKDAPKAKDSGIVSVYSPADGPDVAYMETLNKGDIIQVQYNGKRYDFVVPAGWTPPAKRRAVTSGQSEVVSKIHEYVPASSGEIAAKKALIDEEAGLLAYAYFLVSQWAEQYGITLSEDSTIRTANGLRISAEREHKQGTVIIAEPVTQVTEDVVVEVSKKDGKKFKDDLFKNGLDPDDLIRTALDGIVGLAPLEYDIATLKRDMTYIGIERTDFYTKTSSLGVAQLIWSMLDLVKGGMEKDAALSTTRDLHAW